MKSRFRLSTQIYRVIWQTHQILLSSELIGRIWRNLGGCWHVLRWCLRDIQYLIIQWWIQLYSFLVFLVSSYKLLFIFFWNSTYIHFQNEISSKLTHLGYLCISISTQKMINSYEIYRESRKLQSRHEHGSSNALVK